MGEKIDYITDVEIRLTMEKGETLTIELTKEEKKVVLSLIMNLFKNHITFKEDK